MDERESFFRNPYREGATVHMAVDKIAYGGEGLGRVGATVMFVAGAIPGDVIEARIIDVQKNFLRGYLINILQPSPLRVPPPCPVYDRCGGCHLQTIAPESQQQVKKQILDDCLRDLRAAHPAAPLPLPMITSPEGYGYRLRCQLKTEWDGRQRIIGFYARRSGHLIRITSCPICAPALNNVMPAAASLLELPAFQGREIKSLELVTNNAGDGLLITIQMKGRPPAATDLFPVFKERLPMLRGLGCGAGYAGVEEQPLFETVGGDNYRISLGSFFQINRFLLGQLREQCVNLLAPTAEDIVVDLFCGTGFFTLPLARLAKRVVGVESNLAAVQDAHINATAADCKNVKFMARPAEQFRFDRPAGKAPSEPFTMAFIDPPRQGCHTRLIDVLIANPLRRLLYLSCNPTTMVRDINALAAGGYKLTTLQPFDFFPQTYHLELAAVLEWTGSI